MTRQHLVYLASLSLSIGLVSPLANAPWGGERAVETGAGHEFGLRMVVSGNFHYAYYKNTSPGHYENFVSSSRDGGRSWDVPLNLPGDSVGWGEFGASGPL